MWAIGMRPFLREGASWARTVLQRQMSSRCVSRETHQGAKGCTNAQVPSDSQGAGKRLDQEKEEQQVTCNGAVGPGAPRPGVGPSRPLIRSVCRPRQRNISSCQQDKKTRGSGACITRRAKEIYNVTIFENTNPACRFSWRLRIDLARHRIPEM